MKEPNDRELKDQLADGPFARGGFDQRLRQRIMERIDGEQKRSRNSRVRHWILPLGAASMLAVILLGIWLWQGTDGANESKLAQTTPSAPAATLSSPSATAAAVQTQRKYALLIGLRTDNAGKFSASSYRTVLVASDQTPDQLRQMSENDGLYMPYKQNFWNIATVISSDDRSALQAVQVTNRKIKEKDASVSVPETLLSERVVYAGNEYLSIVDNVRTEQGGTAENRWVKKISQINDKAQTPPNQLFLKLQDAIPATLAPSTPVEQWTIERDPGKWLPVTYDPVTGAEETIAADLPSQIVQNDKLLMSWDDIRKIEPNTRDAFTYGHILGVVTDTDIRVHAVRNGTSVSDAVVIPLKKNESVIMIQWAQDQYVDRWIADLRMLAASRP